MSDQKQLHIKKQVYIHATKVFAYVFCAFIGGISIGFFGIQIGYAQNSTYEPLRYFATILNFPPARQTGQTATGLCCLPDMVRCCCMLCFT